MEWIWNDELIENHIFLLSDLYAKVELHTCTKLIENSTFISFKSVINKRERKSRNAKKLSNAHYK